MILKLEKYEEDYFKRLAFRLYTLKWDNESSIICIKDDSEKIETEKIMQIANKYGFESNYISSYIRFRWSINIFIH